MKNHRGRGGTQRWRCGGLVDGLSGGRRVSKTTWCAATMNGMNRIHRSISKLTADEKETRNDFEYVPKSPFPEKLCNNCDLWLEPQEETLCGGCEIMEGPIHPEGYCNVWLEIS